MIAWSLLEERARQAATQAYAPYSNYRVGAALLAASGTIYTGCNVETASYGGTICAERVALTRAVVEGERDFTALVVAAGVEVAATPCGICREVLRELCQPGLAIRCVTLEAGVVEPVVYTLAELLPHSFVLEKRSNGA